MAIVADKSGNTQIAIGSYATHTRTNAGTPLATLVPLFAGEIVLDVTNGIRYRATTLLNTGWVVLANVPIGI